MSQLPTITIAGNAGSEPNIGVTGEGKAWARFSVGVTGSRYDKAQQEWIDGDTSWYSVSCFGQLAEHVGDSVKKGDRVVVMGKLQMSVYEKDGQQRVSADIKAEDVGRSLLFSGKPRVAAAAAPADDIPPF